MGAKKLNLTSPRSAPPGLTHHRGISPPPLRTRKICLAHCSYFLDPYFSNIKPWPLQLYANAPTNAFEDIFDLWMKFVLWIFSEITLNNFKIWDSLFLLQFFFKKGSTLVVLITKTFIYLGTTNHATQGTIKKNARGYFQNQFLTPLPPFGTDILYFSSIRKYSPIHPSLN